MLQGQRWPSRMVRAPLLFTLITDLLESYMYTYHTARGNAVLCKGDDQPLKKIGKYKTEKEAREACEAHYAKTCKALRNLNKPIPPVHYA